MLVRLGARRWVFTILIVWGAISAACAFVQGPMSFYVLRFLLGVAEAGLFPGVVLYLTYWFPQERRARAIASFMAASPLAFVVVGPLSGLLLAMDGIARSQRLAVAVPHRGSARVPARVLPAEARPRRSRARRLAQRRGEAPDRRSPRAGAIRSTSPASGRRCATRGFTCSASPISRVGAGGYGMRLWLPQIVQGMGFSNLANGFVVAMPYLLAVGAMIWWGHVERQERRAHLARRAAGPARGVRLLHRRRVIIRPASCSSASRSSSSGSMP